MRFIDKEIKDLENFAGGLEDRFNAIAEAQERTFQVLVDSPVVPDVQVAKVAKARKFGWSLTDYKADGGTVHLTQKGHTMVIFEDGTYKRTKN